MSTRTIDSENSKTIRAPLEMHCGLSAVDTSHTATITEMNSVALADTNYAEALRHTDWPVAKIADLSQGIPLDAGVVFPEQNHVASESTGKYGIYSHTGGNIIFDATVTSDTVSLQAAGSGTLTVGGRSYTLYPYMVADTSSGGTTKHFTTQNEDENGRVIIYGMQAGVVLEFTNDTLISVVLDLAGNLSLDEPSMEVSSIEITAYHPDDIEEIISQVSEDAPIWYYSGYPGDYSLQRCFYLAETVTQTEDGAVTIKGVDASGRLENYSVRSELLHRGTSGTYPGANELYTRIRNVLRTCNIPLTHYDAPGSDLPAGTPGTYGQYGVLKEQSAQDLLAAAMLDTHISPDSFWITYIDAGRPALTYKYKAYTDSSGLTIYIPPWQEKVLYIYEENCADIEKSVSRKINKIAGENGYLSHQYSLRNVTESVGYGVKKDAAIGEVCSAETDGEYIAAPQIQNVSKTYYISATGAKWLTKKAGTTGLYGKPLTATTEYVSEAANHAGVTLILDPFMEGKVLAPGGEIPNYGQRLNGSNKTGKFVFRGDPRMQPRDVVKLVRRGGLVQLATVERIQLTHEGGGTTAEVYYRMGVC